MTPKVWRGVIERGANWVSGVAPPGVHKGGAAGVAKGLGDLPWQNPVYHLAVQVDTPEAIKSNDTELTLSPYQMVPC